MADPTFPAAPQTFSFRAGPTTLTLQGVLVSFNGQAKRRHADHEFLKRDGQRVEDMGRKAFRLEVELHFIGADAASRYQTFKQAVLTNPSGLLTHPIAGSWYAFCEGPDEHVSFSEAINRIVARCVWLESQLDAQAQADVPDVATAGQNCTAQQTTFQQTIATFMGKLAKASTTIASALNAVDAAMAQISQVTAPVSFVRSAINIAIGGASSIIGTLSGIQTENDLLVQDVTNFVAAATIVFNGTADTTPPGTTDQVGNALATVQTDALNLEALLIAASPRPATAADAVADVEVMVYQCMLLNDAVAAAQPPVVQYRVPALENLLVIAQRLIQQWNLRRQALEYASAIMGYNRIANPAAIPAGTVLNVPAQ